MQQLTSASTWAAAMHFSADSLLLNWANAQPGENTETNVPWIGFPKQKPFGCH